jgi:F-type H+-transporting ATPase subunit alpha
VGKQVIVIYAATNGYIDPVPVDRVQAYESELFQFMETRKADLVALLAERKAIDDEIKPQLNAALEEFGKTFAASAKVA